MSVATSNCKSIDPSQVTVLCKKDGCLPDIYFMHLEKGSDFIDAGENIKGMAINGDHSDLGCFETEVTVAITAASDVLSVPFNWYLPVLYD